MKDNILANLMLLRVGFIALFHFPAIFSKNRDDTNDAKITMD